jgi:hypothetical protein
MELFEMIAFGTKVTAHGEEWFRIMPVGIDYYIAVKADEKSLPAQLYLIRPEKKNAS